MKTARVWFAGSAIDATGELSGTALDQWLSLKRNDNQGCTVRLPGGTVARADLQGDSRFRVRAKVDGSLVAVPEDNNKAAPSFKIASVNELRIPRISNDDDWLIYASNLRTLTPKGLAFDKAVLRFESTAKASLKHSALYFADNAEIPLQETAVTGAHWLTGSMDGPTPEVSVETVPNASDRDISRGESGIKLNFSGNTNPVIFTVKPTARQWRARLSLVHGGGPGPTLVLPAWVSPIDKFNPLAGRVSNLVIDDELITGEFEAFGYQPSVSGPHEAPAYVVIDMNDLHDDNVLVKPYRGRFVGNIAKKTIPVADAAFAAIPYSKVGIADGEGWIAFSGEVLSLSLVDRANGPVSIHADNVAIFQARTQNVGPAVVAEGASFTWQRFPVSGHGGRYGVLPCVSMGDTLLVPSGVLNGRESPDGNASFYNNCYPGKPDGEWKFDIERLVKTPFKGDAELYTDADLAGFGDRREYYPSASGVSTISFTSEGVCTKPNLFDSFALPKGRSNTVLCHQPANTRISFGEGTRLERATSPVTERQLWSAVASGAPASPGTRYSQTDATLRFPDVPSGNVSNYDQEPRVSLSAAPDLNNEYIVVDAIGQKACNILAHKDTHLPLGIGWQIAKTGNECVADKPIVKINLKKNLEGVGNAPAGVRKPAVEIEGNTWRILDANGSKLGLDQAFDKKGRIQRLLRADSNPSQTSWSGVLVRDAKLDPEYLVIPESIKVILKTVELRLAWVDGQGASVFAEVEEVDEQTPSTRLFTAIDPVTMNVYDPPLMLAELRKPYEKLAPSGKPDLKHIIVLTGLDFLIVANRVEQLKFTLWWSMPFFDRTSSTSSKGSPKSPERQYLIIQGGLETDPSGVQRLTLTAKLPDKEKRIEVGWLGIKSVVLDKLGISRRKDQDDWKISIDGKIEFDPTTPELATWFNKKLESLDFSQWEIDFDNPFDNWNFPALRLNNALEYQLWKGFKFNLSSFSLPKPDGLNRRLDLLGFLRIGTPKFGFAKKLDLFLRITLDLGDFTDIGKFAVKIEETGIFKGDFDFNLFEFLRVELTDANWDKSTHTFGGTVKVTPKWQGAGEALTMSLRFSAMDGESYWVIGFPASAAGGRNWDIGPVKLQEPSFLVGHRAGYPGMHQDIVKANEAAIIKLLSGADGSKAMSIKPRRKSGVAADDLAWLTKWQFAPEYEWVIGVHAKLVEVSGKLFTGKELLLLLCDDDAFRMSGDLEVLGFKLSGFSAAINWRSKFVDASIKPSFPEFPYGAYKVSPPTIGLGFGDGMLKVSMGFPEGGNWGRALSMRWESPPAIPINKIEGGFLARIDSGSKPAFTFAVALRAGYEKVIGSDGGAFGAYLSGSFMIGGIMASTLTPRVFITKGVFIFDANAKGGVIVFGIRWDIFTVYVHAGVAYELVVSARGMSTQWGANFSAGFRICLTPCTCISGSCSFSQGMSESQATDYSPPDDEQLLQWNTPPHASLAGSASGYEELLTLAEEALR